ncbi:unnamed protein product [Symbiodinium sp. CCMP2592]|nr:unnamed protein product [Symbiodinium sp. CCMP2592]
MISVSGNNDDHDQATNINTVEPVQLADEGRRCSWRVAMPAERLASLRPGDMLESPTFTLPGGCRGRFQLFPKGETDEMEPGHCSLWLCADAPVLENIRLRLGSVEASRGSATFCRLEDALQGDVMDLSLELDTAEAAAQAPPEVEQRLLISDLQYAEWQLFQAGRIDEKARVNGSGFVSSPPFRFHHVLLGDMYLELIPDVPNKDLCAVMFRCRVPGLSMKVSLSIGTAFSKTLMSQGTATIQEDLVAGQYLQVNLRAPGVLAEDGSLTVQCALDQVVSMPRQLEEMIPRLDERVNWPKRI